MPVNKPGLFASLSNPLKGNRYFGLFFTVLLVMGALGLAYYLNVMGNQERYATYRFQSLDALESRFTKLLENKIQQARQKKDTAKNNAIKRVFEKPTLSSVAANLPWQDSFEEFVVEQKKGDSSEVIYHSFSSNIGSLAFAQDSTYALEKRVKFMNDEYRVFANTYTHPGDTLKVNSNDHIVYYGLVKQSSFDRDNLRLDVWLVIILGMVLLLILLGLPFFKLIFISEIERLYRRDVVFTGLSVVVGVPILALIFLSLFHYGNRYYQDVPNSLASQSEQIRDRFHAENEQIVNQLYDLRTKVDDMFKGGPIEKGRTYFRLDLTSEHFKTYNNFKVIGKVSSKGEINRQLISTMPVPAGNLKDLSGRSYFKSWQAGDHSYLNGNTKPYVMRPVISLEAGTEESIYVVPVEDGNLESCLIAASVSLKSLQDPILAKGYQFAIVDDDGMVFFHSEKGRSTLENILTSTLENQELKSALATNASSRIYFDYMGTSMIGFVRPIPGHDLHVISMYDTQLLRLQISEIVSLGSIGIISAIMITGLLALITIFSRQPKSNFYKYTRFPFRFLEPDKHKMRGYLVLIVCFLLQLLCNGIFIYDGDQSTSTVFLSNLLLMLWAYIFVYYRFNLLTRRKTKSGGTDDGSSAEHKTIWQKQRDKFRSDLSEREERLEIKQWKPRIGDIFIVFFILLLNGFLESTLQGGYWVLFIIQFLFLVMMVVSLLLGNRVDSFLSAIVIPFGKKSYKQVYIAFLFVWLFLTSVFPSYHYFLEASRIEQEIWNKETQLELAKAYEAKINKLDKNLNFASESREKLHNDHLREGYYDVNKARYKIVKTINEQGKKKEDSKVKDLLYRIRPVYHELIAGNQPLVYDVAFGDKWFWQKPEGSKAIKLNYKLEGQDSTGFELVYEQGKDTEPYFFRSERKARALFLIIFIALLIGIYSLIYFAVYRIFGFHYERYQQKDKMLEECHDQIRQILSGGERPANLAIVGFPFSGKLSMMLEILHKSKGKHIASISCMNLTGEVGNLNFILKPQNEPNKALTGDDSITKESIKQKETNTIQDLKGFDTCIIQNFEFGYQNHEANKLKLDLLSFLVGSGKHVIILTDIYPSQVLAFYRRSIEAATETSAEEQQAFNAWHAVFGSFTDILYGFKHERTSVHEGIRVFEQNHQKQVESSTWRLAENELGFGTYLPTLAEPTLTRTAQLTDYSRDQEQLYIDLSKDYYNEGEDKSNVALYEAHSDQFILQVQSMAHGYYNNIWNSLATREKFIAYDLARDGFVNTKNGSALYSLMKKGLVVWKNKPLLFNKSFRNFVIASVSREEAKAMEKVISKTGSWGIARLVLYMVIIGIVGFLMIGEPQFVSDFQTFVGVLAGLATVVPVISSFIGNKAGNG